MLRKWTEPRRARHLSPCGMVGAALSVLLAWGVGGCAGATSNTPPPGGTPDTTPPSLSSITASATTSGATIAWTTSEPADSQVEYGATSSYGQSTAVNAVLITSHSVTVSGLNASTAYHYRVKSKDAAGNLAASGDFTFTTTAAADTTPPTIFSVSASGITTTGATITWITNEGADSQVEYGTTAAYGQSTTLAAALVTSHSAALGGLTASTLYHYRVKSKDAAGNPATSSDFTFTTSTTPDTTPPTISSVSASGITTTSAAIAWITNEAADSQVDYGTTTAYGQSTPLAAALVTSHSAALSGLTASTLYHYRVKSKDAAGNLATSSDFTFTTSTTPDTTPPVLSAVSASGVTASGATITWTTNEAADSQVEYGTTAAYGQSTTLAAALVTSHSAALGGLTASTLYHYRVKSKDAAGNPATSGDFTFTTAASADTTPPSVSMTAPGGGTTVSGTITLTASASDNVGVAGVQFRADGASTSAEDTTSPYSISFDTRTVANGSHTFSAVARDAAGNLGTAAGVTVTVNNAAPPPGGPITVGTIEVDPPTLQTIGLSLPITSGDTNYNAIVQVFYRKSGDTAWSEALPLLRVRPDMLSNEDPSPFTVAEQFAGSIFDLQPDTLYEVRLEVQDADGGSTTQTTSIRTRANPLSDPATPRVVNVASTSQLQTALSAANPGDVILLANGTYNGSVTISRSGTAANPIFVRGQSQAGVILDATGATYGIVVSGTNVTVENLTIQGSSWGMQLASTSDVVVRRLRITNVFFGINGMGGTNRNYYICDNKLEGNGAVWPNTGQAVWDYEGIVVTGSGHVVCYNTISGFGDAMSLHHDTSIPNRAIDFYGNDVLWTGDNGVELDFTDRNVRAFRNRFTNGGNHSMSFQPIWGGPAYAFRNVIYNSASAPYKLNNEPTGFYILQNTAVRPGVTWAQSSGIASNFHFLNNITIGTTGAVQFTSDIALPEIDYDGWMPDGQFTFVNSWSNFADLQANSPYEHHGRLLNGLPFAAPPAIPGSYTTFVSPLDATLSATTNAIDAGVRLPNINDGFAGSAPDLGAMERGQAAPWYGVRP